MAGNTLKKASFIFLGILLLLGAAALLLYLNRQKLYPKVDEVTYLRVEMAKDTALVRAGLLVQNRAPIPFSIDSVNYKIRNDGEKLGWGGQIVGETLPPLGDKELDFRLFLKTDRYRQHLARQKADSLELDVQMTVYFDLPFIEPQNITFNRTITTAVPKPPAFEIDTFLVKSFGPEKGYTFLLQLDAGNTNLPDLKISDLKYEVNFADGTVINGKVDSSFVLNKGEFTVQVPIRLETAEVVELIRKKLAGKKRWTYEAKASAVVRSSHPLFEELPVTIFKSGVLDASGIGGPEMAMPQVKRIKRLELVRKEQKTYLEANLVIQNPSPLPLYIDSARYTVSYQGKVVARGSRNFEKTLPKKGTQELLLQLTVNNDRYRQMMQQAQGQETIPLDIKLDLLYDLENRQPQRITIKKRIEAPVPESAGIEVAGLEVKELNPEKGARLALKLQVKNNKLSGLTIDNLDYDLQLGKDLEISGRSSEPIVVEKGTSEVEIPLNLSGEDVNQLVRRLLQGGQDWNYRFSGSALVSSENGMLQNTKIALQTTGQLETGSLSGGGGKKLMPHIAKIDTLSVTIHYDTAWVKLHLQVENPLPVPINVQELVLKLNHQNDLFGIVEEKRQHKLPAEGTAFAWLTLAVNYATWESHVKHHQDQDSMQLEIPLSLRFSIGKLPAMEVPISLDTRIPMPYTPVTLLQKTKFAGFNSAGLKFNGDVLVQNANAKGLEISAVDYQIELENGVDMCGKINRTYDIPLDQSHLKFPISLSFFEALKMLKRQLFGPPELNYKINATAKVRTANPKIKDTYLIFENHNKTNMKKKKQPSPRLKKKEQPQTAAK